MESEPKSVDLGMPLDEHTSTGSVLTPGDSINYGNQKRLVSPTGGQALLLFD